MATTLRHVLHPLNDYPVHQTSAPLEEPASGDPNHYDRYFFNGYTPDGSLYFGAALGLYPNRGIIDAAFSVLRGGQQVSVHASGVLPGRERPTAVGPIAVDVVEPLRVLRLRVSSPEHGLEAEVVFRAVTVAVKEPRFHSQRGTRTVFDYTRLTQWGRWDGWVSVDGERIGIDGVLGSRDRSWGVRPVGERTPGPAQGLPQFFWLWAPVHFPEVCTHFDVNEEADGRRWHQTGFVVPVCDPRTAPVEAVEMDSVDWAITWEPGTRRAAHARIELRRRGEADRVVELEPIATFQMLGIGYLHPEWGHGHWKGDLAVGGERWKVADLDPVAAQHVHVQQLCRATLDGTTSGTGILEILAIGPHPSGLTGIFDGFVPR